MKVLFLSTDRTLFADSKARARMARYGEIFDEVHAVVYTKREYRRDEVRANVTLYPTNSASRWFSPWDTYRVASGIVAGHGRDELIVSAQDPFEGGVAGWLLKRRWRLPLQVQVHTDFLSPYFAREHWENRVRVFLAHFILKRADCIRVVSKRIQTGLVRSMGILERKISVLPVWNDFNPMPRKATSGDALRVLLVSRLEPEKGVADAIRAFAQFLGEGGKGVLNIVGDGSLRVPLATLAKDLRISGSVVFEGWQKNLDMYYSRADLLLFPSHYEGWGMAAYDAVRAGIPVVMTDVGLAGEVVKDGKSGIIVPVGDMEKMTGALLSLYRDRGLLHALGHSSLKISGILSWDEYLQAYRKMLEGCAR
ncbi:MAG: glycosyltransferase [Candidatus Sungbacteria bacterium]|nr:glycosyltransferase [Candidatus Sungbacteria bacterium]